MIKSIRPKVIFQKIEEKFPNQNVNFIANIPSSNIGGLTLLEHSVLASMIKFFDSKNIFEFGTFMGASSFVMAVNSAADAHITTLDIAQNDIAINKNYNEGLRDIENDNFLRNEFVGKGAIYINQADEKTRRKITQIYHNSLTLDCEKHDLLNSFDLVFIDGGHDYKTIENDTLKALQMVKKDAIIIWHDFKSNLHTNVTDFIGDFSKSYDVINVEATMLAFTLIGKYRDLFSV